jgi:hypothetical protein
MAEWLRPSKLREYYVEALNIEDLEETAEGMLVTLRRSKTDQEGVGRKVAIPRGEVACPVAAVKAWLDAAGITEGAIFRRIFNKRSPRVPDRRLAARNVAAVTKAALRGSASTLRRSAATAYGQAS